MGEVKEKENIVSVLDVDICTLKNDVYLLKSFWWGLETKNGQASQAGKNIIDVNFFGSANWDPELIHSSRYTARSPFVTANHTTLRNRDGFWWCGRLGQSMSSRVLIYWDL